MCSLVLLIGTLIVLINVVSNVGDSNTLRTNNNGNTVQNDGCILPQHPNNGYWMILNGNGKPGKKVDQNSILTFKCHKGYTLTDSPNIFCFVGWNAQKMPECRPLCPPMYSTSTTILNCTDASGRSIDCSKATDGSLMKYDCVPFYEPVPGQRKVIYCIEGTWSQPKPQCQPICGKKIDATKLIYGGEVLEKHVYPWVVALYQKDDDEFMNICGGTIISRQAVITAAHCVTNEYADVHPPEMFRIAAAKLYSEYKEDRDKNAKYFKILRIVVHPQYKGETRRFLGDIALLITNKPFKLKHAIQPVCINDLNTIYLQPGSIGEVAGWGATENNLPSDELRAIAIPYKSEADCSRELPKDWAEKYNILDKICAGYPEKNISVCKGDSGSGLVFKNIDDNRYYLHGIVSLSPFTGTAATCNIYHSALYTKVSFYYDFIDGELTRLNACRLPPFPKNGRWIVEEFPEKSPGDIIALNDIVTIICYEGYSITKSNSTIDCETLVSNMPVCQRTSNITTCGKKRIENNLQLKVNGQVINHSDYPWMAAVYYNEGPNVENSLRCLGTIISSKLVVAATICFLYRFNQELVPNDLIIATGKFYKNYENPRDFGARYYEISKFIRKDYSGKRDRQDDFGLLLVKNSIEFNDWVQPVCIDDLIQVHMNVGDIGEVAYWRKDNSLHQTATLSTVEVTNKNLTNCMEEEKIQLLSSSSPMGICAASTQGSICNEDLGAGLVFKNPLDKLYYLVGIYRFSPVKNNVCSNNGFYIKVNYDLIREHINKYL